MSSAKRPSEDERPLRELAELDSQRPLSAPVLIGEIDGVPAAALSLSEGRVVADPFQPTAVLSQLLRVRATALRTHARTPSLAEGVRAVMAPFRAARISQA